MKIYHRYVRDNSSLSPFWRTLLYPPCWYRFYRINYMWDSELRKILNNINRVEIERYSTTINGVLIWVGIFPGFYGQDFRGLVDHNELPTRRTMWQLYDVERKERREFMERRTIPPLSSTMKQSLATLINAPGSIE